MMINKICHRVKKRGEDPTGLGRWTWTTTKGKGAIIVRTGTVYCPHDTGGPESVYAQHRFYLNTKDDDRSPRVAFWEDLCKEVKVWEAAGNQIIIGGDFNQDTATIHHFQQFNMRDALRQRHDGSTEDKRPTPATYNRGTTTLDAIFVTPSLVCSFGGYLEYGQFTPSDHRAPWIDIKYQVAYGNVLPDIVKAPARRLKCSDPRIVKQFNDTYEAFLRQHKLHEKALHLRQHHGSTLEPHLQRLYERIDQKRNEGVLYAERRCRKIRMGKVPFSEKVQAASTIVDALSLQLSKLQGRKTSSRLIQQKAKLPYTALSIDECKSLRKQAIKRYIELKKQGPELRKTFMEQLAEARAVDGNTSAANELKQLQIREQQRVHWRNIKRVTGQLNGGGGTFVTKLQPNGIYKPL
jgi:hypothetical protein